MIQSKKFKEFVAWMPSSDPNQLISEPYDTLSEESARAILLEKPNNILRVTYPKVNLITDKKEFRYLNVHKNCKNILLKMIKDKIIIQDSYASYYLYKLTTNTHTKIGITVAVNINLYKKSKIIKHENVLQDIIQDRKTHFSTLNFQVGPVMLACFSDEYIFSLIEKFSNKNKPIVESKCFDTVHQIWKVDDKRLSNQIEEFLENKDYFYIIDGHHRIESINKLAKEQKLNYYFLATIFSMEQIKLYPFHKLIIFDSKSNVINLLDILNKNSCFTILEKDFLEKDSQFGIFILGKWYKIQYNIQAKENKVLVDLLYNNILPEISNILGQYTIKNVLQDELYFRVNDYATNKNSVIFTLPIPNKRDFFNQRGYIAPPKSTCCNPKLADGLIMYDLKEGRI